MFFIFKECWNYFKLGSALLYVCAGMTDTGAQCWGGYYCPTGIDVPNPALYLCPRGMHCPNGSEIYKVYVWTFCNHSNSWNISVENEPFSVATHQNWSHSGGFNDCKYCKLLIFYKTLFQQLCLWNINDRYFHKMSSFYIIVYKESWYENKIILRICSKWTCVLLINYVTYTHMVAWVFLYDNDYFCIWTNFSDDRSVHLELTQTRRGPPPVTPVRMASTVYLYNLIMPHWTHDPVQRDTSVQQVTHILQFAVLKQISCILRIIRRPHSLLSNPCLCKNKIYLNQNFKEIVNDILVPCFCEIRYF